MAQTSLYSICKEFLVLLPKPLYYSLQHIFIWHEGFLVLYKRLKVTWLQPGAVCRMFAYLPFQFGVHLVRNSGPYGRGHCAAGWCCQWVYRSFFLWSLYTDLKRFTVAFGFTLSLRDLKSRYPSGTVRIDSPLWTPSSSFAVVSSVLFVHAVKCTALPKCLKVGLLGITRVCTIFTATAAPRTGFICTCRVCLLVTQFPCLYFVNNAINFQKPTGKSDNDDHVTYFKDLKPPIWR